MSANDWIAIIGAVASGVVLIIGALGVLFMQMRQTHNLVNHRMDELLALTQTSARAAGVLQESERRKLDRGA